ncbi:hypothetical protein [Parasitella parasitica]|uniref:J domain-containing protein n=1 Tax=Parasitella parasitica TaxID=35722 RepID=A0A0B7NVH8_9FUNG|nr:hypothetical protein [Parasitella parasitica]
MIVDCYKLLQLDKENATLSDIKRAYRKLALQYHPDKQPIDASDEQKQQANTSFQQLGKAYAVLSDPKRKERYDRTGNMDDGEFEGDKDWDAYFKELWTGVVNAETIEAQKLKYQGSEEEKKDLLAAYVSCKGNMDRILQSVECSSAVDGERFEKLIRTAVEEKAVPIFRAFDKSTTPQAHQKRIVTEQKEAAAFEKQQAKDKKKNKEESKTTDDDSSLLALIQNRAKERNAKMNSIIDSIEEKHGRKRKELNMPSEEEFLKLQSKMFKKK